ncbi:MAG: hypothetical protein ACI8PT_004444 [Gammaproteobacteria bacterium]|jgi:hypothetical protein
MAQRESSIETYVRSRADVPTEGEPLGRLVVEGRN